MKKIIPFLLICSVGCATPLSELRPAQRLFARNRAMALRDDVSTNGLTAMAAQSDTALKNLMGEAFKQLRANGQGPYADQKETEWNSKFNGFLSKHVNAKGLTDIGDHKPLLQWLADFYAQVELALGVGKCKSLHLSDIKTFNFTIPVVFAPCSFPMDAITIPRINEYKNHFNGGDVYYGLMPVVTYWVVDIACMIATQGAGTGWVCGPVGGASEWLMYETFSPRMSDTIFNKTCPNATGGISFTKKKK